MKECQIEDTKYAIEMRLRHFGDKTMILTADHLLFKVNLTGQKVSATLLREFEDELDPILFIDKMQY